jgi:hypothetical protein
LIVDQSSSYSGRAAFLKMLIFLMTFLTVGGWVASWCWLLSYFWVAALLGLVVALRLGIRWAGSAKNLLAGLREPLGWWPFLLLMAMIIVAGLVYPPTMLDSLTYRLPRIFAWMREGHIQFMPTVEDRMNFMPHSWSLCELPLLQLFGDRLVWIWSFLSWIFLCLVAYDWAFALNNDRQKSRLMAFLIASSVYAVLQAESSANDLFAGVLMLLALRFVMEFEKNRDWREIIWVVLCFGLGAGTKPQFSVLGLPLVLWFFCSPAKPWRAFRWAWLPALVPVWLLCSPLPSFVMNQQSYGTIGGPGQDASITGKSPLWNCVAGSAMIVWQNIQPPISPVGLFYNERLKDIPAVNEIRQTVPRFNLRVAAVAMVDSATLGLVASALVALGLWLALKRRVVAWNSWQVLALATGLAAMLMALARMVSENSGRAFEGFVFFLFPLALVGWNQLSRRQLKIAFALSLLSAITALTLTPSRPLWPAAWIHQKWADSGQHLNLLAKLEPYFRYADRATTAQEIIAAIPPSETEFAALVGMDRPLLPLYRPYSAARKVDLLPHDATPMDLNLLPVRYVVVGGGAEEDYPALCQYLRESKDYELVMRHAYTPRLARGSEDWELYLRRPKPPQAQTAASH